MTATIISNLLRTKFRDEITVPIAITTVWDNEIREASELPASGPWCRHFVQLGESLQISFGGPGARRFRTAGQVLIHLFAPLGQGDGDQLEIVDAIQAAYRAKTVNSGNVFVEFDSPSVVAGSSSVDDKWWLTAVAVPFRADEVAQ